MLVIGVVASIVLTAITLLMDWFPEPASTAADDIDFLYDLLLVASSAPLDAPPRRAGG